MSDTGAMAIGALGLFAVVCIYSVVQSSVGGYIYYVRNKEEEDADPAADAAADAGAT